MKFEKGKVYKTREGHPAKILWIDTNDGTLYVLHQPYTKEEGVLLHEPSGKFSDVLPELDLTEEIYEDTVSNTIIKDWLE